LSERLLSILKLLDAYNEHVDQHGVIQRRLARLLTPQQSFFNTADALAHEEPV